MPKCECKVCDRNQKLLDISDRLPEYSDFVEELASDLENAETDAVFWEMKFKGTWPGDK